MLYDEVASNYCEKPVPACFASQEPETLDSMLTCLAQRNANPNIKYIYPNVHIGIYKYPHACIYDIFVAASVSLYMTTLYMCRQQR